MGHIEVSAGISIDPPPGRQIGSEIEGENKKRNRRQEEISTACRLQWEAVGKDVIIELGRGITKRQIEREREGERSMGNGLWLNAEVQLAS